MKPYWLHQNSVVCVLLCSPFAMGAEPSHFNMTQGATQISRDVYSLHMAIFYICCGIALVVFGLMFWAIVRHRKARGSIPEQFHGSLTIELLWTAIPVLILVAMAVPATRTLIAMEDTAKAELTVLVTGSQWKWHYQYLEYPIEFYSLLATPREQINNTQVKGEHYLREVDNPLVLPSGKKIRLLMTSIDVIHSWWLPAFAIKKDANPGFINEAWTRVDEPGIYRGQCAELCGRDHAYMPVVVEVKTPDDFALWVQHKVAQQAQARAAAAAQATMTREELMTLGQTTYETRCAPCHQATGLGIVGVFPALKGSAIATKDLAAHLHIVLFGKQGTAMQAFAQQLSPGEIAAVITYERNAWGNATGDLVQPKDVAAAQKIKE